MSTEASSRSLPDGDMRFLPWLVALLTAYIIFTGTPWGPGLTPDAVAYVHSAGLLENGQLAQLPTHWPPGFPMALAFGELIFGDLMTAGRAILAIAGAASILLYCRLLQRCGITRQVASLVALLLLVQPGFLDVHLMMWSEPLFLALVLLDLLWLHDAIRFPERRRYWLLLGLACGSAIIVRYAGFFLVPVNMAAICFFSLPKQERRARLLAAAVTAGVSLAPLLVWIAFNHWRGASGTNRELVWHPAGWYEASEIAHTVADWFQLPGALGAAAALAILLTFLANMPPSRSGGSDASIMPGLVSLAAIFYIVFLWASVSLFDNSTPLDQRILFPIFPLCLASMAMFLKRSTWLPRRVAPVLAAPLILVMAFGAYAGWKDWRHSRAEGNYLSSRGFQEMAVLKWLRSLPADGTVMTNGPEIFEIYLRRKSEMLPEKFSPTSRVPARNYPQALAGAMARANMVVYFRPMARRTYLTGVDEIDRFAAFRRAYQGDDAIVWIKTAAPAR